MPFRDQFPPLHKQSSTFHLKKSSNVDCFFSTRDINGKKCVLHILKGAREFFFPGTCRVAAHNEVAQQLYCGVSLGSVTFSCSIIKQSSFSESFYSVGLHQVQNIRYSEVNWALGPSKSIHYCGNHSSRVCFHIFYCNSAGLSNVVRYNGVFVIAECHCSTKVTSLSVD